MNEAREPQNEGHDGAHPKGGAGHRQTPLATTRLEKRLALQNAATQLEIMQARLARAIEFKKGDSEPSKN